MGSADPVEMGSVSRSLANWLMVNTQNRRGSGADHLAVFWERGYSRKYDGRRSAPPFQYTNRVALSRYAPCETSSDTAQQHAQASVVAAEPPVRATAWKLSYDQKTGGFK